MDISINQITQQQKQQIIPKQTQTHTQTSQNKPYQQQHISNKFLSQQQQNITAWQYKHQTLKQPDHRFDQYIQMLIKNGALISNKLKCGLFQLKNGLTYPGLYAQQQINPNLHNNQGTSQILVTIPTNLLLTSYKAQHQSSKQLIQIYKNQQFYHIGPIWQNRIIITYILYILAYQKQTMWSKMAINFSKDIDILSFWAQQDINKFIDKSVIKAASLQRQNYQQQYKQFKKVQQKYTILQNQWFGYENYKWIYIHVISRCFGSYIGCTYFVPFCQFFNHNCVDVSYCCLQQQQYQQKIQQQKQQKQDKQIEQIETKQNCQNNNQQQQQQQISQISQQSGNSQDYIQQGDYNYNQIQTYTIKWCSKISYNLKPKQQKQIQKQFNKILLFLQSQIKWYGFNLLYIGQIIEKSNIIVNQYMAERKRYQQAKEQLELLVYHIGQYKRIVKKYYKSLGCNYYVRDKIVENVVIQRLKQQQKQENNNHNNTQNNKQQQQQQLQQKNTKYKNTTKQPDKPYTNFIMQCHSCQSFPKNSQVYFQYNRLSNRTLLLRYGFALQNNKYQHVWLRRSLVKQLGQYPDLVNKMRQKAISIIFKIKLKPYVVNTQLIVLYKVQKWKIYGNVQANSVRDFQRMFGIWDIQLQCQIITQIIQLYKQQIPKYQQSSQPQPQPQSYNKNTINNNNNNNNNNNKQSLIDLTNKQLSYHDYFRSVYHNQKIKILLLQIKLLNKCKQILLRVKNQGISIKGNSNLIKILKKITMEVMGNRRQAKAVWGYIKTLHFSLSN